MGSASAEMSLKVIRTKVKYGGWDEDGLNIHNDETVVSGDISDPEFIEAIVSDMVPHLSNKELFPATEDEQKQK